MRRSARDTKKPEVLTYTAPVSESDSEFFHEKKKSKKVVQTSRSSILRKLMSDGDDDEEDEDDEEEKFVDDDIDMTNQFSYDVVLKGKKKTRKDNTNNAIESSLFDALQKNKKLSTEIDNWISNYKFDKISAVVELINFVLSAAGADRNWIESDVDLEALESEEIDELLEDMIKSFSTSDGSKFYPLNEKKSKGKSFRDKYILFWESLTQKIRLIPQDLNKKSFNSYDILNRIVEQLVSFSTIALVNIRDAVSEAAFCIANVLLSECQELKEQVEVAQRQMNAEENKSKGVATQNPKYQAYLNQKNSSNKDLKSLMDICDSIFNTIFIHRFKDAQSDVRLVCIRHINEWILFDLKRDIKVEYLKYLGWACNDPSDNVRLEAIMSITGLLKNEKAVKLMQNFANTFIEHFVDMAYGDISDTVMLNTIIMLRDFQKCGLLDSVSEQTLDIVDSIIFDDQATLRIRQEVLSFVLDHTEGFDEISGGNTSNESKITAVSKNSKKGTAADESKALMHRQKVSLQLETLSEFAEYHKCHHDEGGPEMMAEACLAIHNFDILFDWNSIIALLLRESDELITSALRPPQISILLKMFITSSLEVKQRVQLELQTRAKELELNLKSAKSVSVKSRMVDIWESLTENLHSSLPLLLTRYRDDESNLQTIVILFECCDYSSNHKGLKSLLKVVVDIFNTTSNQQIIKTIINAFKNWQSIGGSIGEDIGNLTQKLLNESWSLICSKSSKLQNLLKNDTTKKSGKRVSGDSIKIEREDLLYSISSGLCKYHSFWCVYDCRIFSDQVIDGIIDELVEVIETISTFSDTAGNVEEQLEKSCISAAVNAEVSIEIIIFWMKYDLVASIKRINEIEESDGNDIEESVNEVIKEIEVIQDSILGSREKVIDVLSTWMAVGQVDDESVSTREITLSYYWRSLRCEAFRSIANFRIIFCSRESKSTFLDKVVFQPSQQVLANMRYVFESEGRKIKEDLGMLDKKNPDDADEIHKLTNHLINFTLLPLTQSLCDIESLNRRQAASIVYYLLEDNDDIDECIKVLLKQIKDSDPVKLLEVEMVALKGIFSEYVLKIIQTRLEAENSNESVDLEKHRELEDQGYDKLELLAKRLSSMLGVGKLKGVLLDALINFFKAGIVFSFSDINQIGFLDSLGHYVKFLPPTEMKEILSFFDNQINNFSDLVREIESDDSSREYQKYTSFLQQIQGQGKARMLNKRKSLNNSKASIKGGKKQSKTTMRKNNKIELEDIDDEDIELDDNDFSPLVLQHIKPKTNLQPLTKDNKKIAKPKATAPVESSRRSNRPGAQKKISYADDADNKDDDDDDDDEFEELISEMHQSYQSQSQSTINIKNTYSQNSKKSELVSQQSKSHDFAMGLDIQEVGDDDQEEEEVIYHSQKAISQKSVSRSQYTQQSENTKKRNLIAAIEDDDDDDDELDNLPARRRFS